MDTLQVNIHTFIHTRILNIKLQRKKKKLSTDKNVDYKNSLHFDNKIASYDLWINIFIKIFFLKRLRLFVVMIYFGKELNIFTPR